MRVHDVIIIGAGPAGIAAAIQLKRYNITPLIIEKNEVGGLLKNANLVENYPGFPSGISGPDLIELFHKQLKNNGLQVQFNEVFNINYENNLFSITTNEEDLFSKTLIIASGTIPRKLSIPDIPEELNNKILYDIYKIKDENGKKIVITGAGDAAFDYAINLSKNNKILILNRGNRTKCLPLLWDRYNNSSDIEYIENTVIKMAEKSNNNIKLTLYNTDTQAENRIDVDYLITAIGREPNLSFINDKFNEKIEELKNKDLLFMIGDVKNNIYRQTTICVGDGVKSAMQVYQKLSEI